MFVGVNSQNQHTQLTLTINTKSQHTKSTNTINTQNQHKKLTQNQCTKSTQKANTKHTKSTNTINTKSQHTKLTHKVNAQSQHYQHTQTHTINTKNQHTKPTHKVNTKKPTHKVNKVNTRSQHTLKSLLRKGDNKTKTKKHYESLISSNTKSFNTRVYKSNPETTELYNISFAVIHKIQINCVYINIIFSFTPWEGNSGRVTWERLQPPQEQRYPCVLECATFLRVQTMGILIDDRLYSAILCSRADSLRLHVILYE